MKAGFKIIFFLIISLQIVSCAPPKIYHYIDSKPYNGVDFSEGKWILNKIDCPPENLTKLTDIVSEFYIKKIGNRFSKITDDQNLLLQTKQIISFSKTDLIKVQKLTDASFLIHFTGKKNRNELNKVEYSEFTVPGANESEAWCDIYDLKTQEKIFSEHVVGRFSENTSKSMFDEPNKKSKKLLKNIKKNTTTNELLSGCVYSILQKLEGKK